MTEILFPRFSKQEYNRRYAEVRRVLEARDLAAVVCYGDRGAPGMLHYLANFPPRWESFLIFPREGEPVLFVQLYNHLPNARSISVIADTRWGGQDSIQTVAEELQHRGLVSRSLGLAGAVPYQRYAALQRAIPALEWHDLSRELGRLRWVKSQEEIDRMRRAAELTDLAVAALAKGLRPGLRERDLPALMQAAVGFQGGQIDLCYLSSTSRKSGCIRARPEPVRPADPGRRYRHHRNWGAWEIRRPDPPPARRRESAQPGLPEAV
jgi:Xaa-Pro aminopeptidase